jgi:hypothetical protein
MLYQPFPRINARAFKGIGLEMVFSVALGKGVSIEVKKGKGFHEFTCSKPLQSPSFFGFHVGESKRLEACLGDLFHRKGHTPNKKGLSHPTNIRLLP